jgi:signal transduction histidine kinase
MVGTVVDVTERKLAEQERERLRKLETEIRHTNRVSVMGELTASLAHEIKQPITAAVSNAEACLQWLAHGQPDLVEMREAATAMVKEARRAAEIITRVRSLFRREAIRYQAVNVNDVITEIASMVREEAGRHSISVRAELDPEVPEVLADRVQLQQVLMNLMLNSVEAMNDTGGELIIRSQPDQNGQLLVSVKDTGLGIPAEKADRIFDAFFTTKQQGTGMGLAISRSIVESHGGRLWADPNSGQGTTLFFTLPKNEGART